MGAKILLVEDEQVIVMFMREMLALLGFDVLAVDHSASALHALQTSDIECAIVDVGLPDIISGDQLVHEIRILRPSLPIILCTAYDTEPYLKEFRDDPCLRVLPKPFGEAHLVRHVLDLLGLEQPTVVHGN